jgi:hypothetical protein
VTGISSIEIPPEAICGERLFFQIVDTSDPQQATATHFRHLSASGAFARRADNPLPAQRIYCTWTRLQREARPLPPPSRQKRGGAAP